MKLLIWSDTPSCTSGLARITRDLATRIAGCEGIEVATVGYGGAGSSRLPFFQYSWSHRADFVMPELPKIWDEFVGDGEGVLLTIQDLGRVLWLADPRYCPDDALKGWIEGKRGSGKMKLWGYFPMDATCATGRLTEQMRHILGLYDRVLAYSGWAAGEIDKALGVTETRFLPHGIDTSVFCPRKRVPARHGFGRRLGARVKDKDFSFPDDALAIGIVATNQARKDYGLGIQAVAEVAKTRKVSLWIHTDVVVRCWSLIELLNEYDLLDRTIVTAHAVDDETLSWCYSALDVTLGIGLGEGFGFPLAESLACGTPCIHGNYAGGAEMLPPEFLVEPVAYRVEGVHSCLRPVYDPKHWAAKIIEVAKLDARLDARYDWNELWPRWKQWLEEK